MGSRSSREYRKIGAHGPSVFPSPPPPGVDPGRRRRGAAERRKREPSRGAWRTPRRRPVLRGPRSVVVGRTPCRTRSGPRTVRGRCFLRPFTRPLTLVLLVFGQMWAASAGGAPSVLGMRMFDGSTHTRVVFDLSAPVDYNLFSLRRPDRVVLDFKAWRSRRRSRTDSAATAVSPAFARRSANDDRYRVVFDLVRQERAKSFLLSPQRPARPSAGRGLRAYARGPGEDRAHVAGAGSVEAGADGPPARRGGGDRRWPRRQGSRRDRPSEKDPGKTRHPRNREEAGCGAAPAAGDPAPCWCATETTSFPFAGAPRSPARPGRTSSSPSTATPSRTRRCAVHPPTCSPGAGRAARRRGGSRRERMRRIGQGGSTSGDTSRWSARRLWTCPARVRTGLSNIVANRVLRKLKGSVMVHGEHVHRAGFAVLKTRNIPALLIETAFLSNPTDEKLLRDDRYQRRLARANRRRNRVLLSAPSAGGDPARGRQPGQAASS